MADLAFLAPAPNVPTSPAPLGTLASPLKGHDGRSAAATATAALRSAAPMALLAAGGVSALVKRRSAQRRVAKGMKIIRQAEDAEASVVQDSEAEKIFREAYEAEAERAALMGRQLEAALAEQLGAPEGIKINIEAPAAPSPDEPGGTTWRKAYEDIKARAASLESQLQKARRLAEPTSASAFSEQSAKVEDNFDAQSAQSTQASTPPPPPQPQPTPAGTSDPMQQMQKLREIANISLEEESVLRLLSLAALANQEGMFKEQQTTNELPPLNQAREALSGEDFMASDALVFERCYVFPGQIPTGRDPEAALEALQQRMRNLTASGAAETELFLQRQKEEGKSLLIMVHKSDLPDDKIEAWQWILWVVLVGLTFFSCLSTPLAVQAVGPGAATGSDVSELVAAFEKVIPIAFCILATVAAQETARRAVASKYGVELTPPYLIPAIPLGSVGCLGVVSRRTSTAPNREAEVNMSLAPPIAGLTVSVGLILVGLALGPDADNSMVNLNYQVLPVLLRFILKPFLGQASVTTQPDPFADPTTLAFPANPLLIGGACGLIVTALNLLPIGRLDGGVLARNALGSVSGPIGLAAWLLLLYGSFGPDDAGALYFAFAFTVLIWQGGAEAPPKEAINDVTPGQQILSIILVLSGLALTLPGYGFPQV